MRQKLRKELRDQSLHFLWTCATFVLPWVAWRVDGLPDWGSWTMTVAAAGSLAFLAAREVWQKRDKPGGILRNWPWLDSAFYGLGAVAGTLVGALVL